MRHTGVVELAGARCPVAGRAKVLREREPVAADARLSEMVHEGVGARHVWSTASHETVPRRRAEGVLRISPLEERTGVGQLIHPRGVHEGVAVRAEIGAEVVHRDEEDIARARVQHRSARATSFWVHCSHQFWVHCSSVPVCNRSSLRKFARGVKRAGGGAGRFSSPFLRTLQPAQNHLEEKHLDNRVKSERLRRRGNYTRTQQN